jgi:hypothetical protein
LVLGQILVSKGLASSPNPTVLLLDFTCQWNESGTCRTGVDSHDHDPDQKELFAKTIPFDLGDKFGGPNLECLADIKPKFDSKDPSFPAAASG